MKKLFFLLVVFVLVPFTFAKAQQGYKYIYADYGYTVNYGGNNVSIGLDLPNRYHHSWDFGLKTYLKKDYESIFLAIRYKPVIYKGINTTFKGRLGALGGSDFSKAIFAPEAGLELSQTVAFGLDFFALSDFGYYINSPLDRWRITIGCGFKIRF